MGGSMGKKKAKRTTKKRTAKVKPELMSLVQYAKYREVSRGAVDKALREGRLTSAAANKNSSGRWQIDPVLADQEWAANSTRQKPGAAAVEHAKEAATVEPTKRLLEFGPDAIPVDQDGNPLTRIEVQTIKEAALAQKAQLDLAEQKGALVRMSDMRTLISELGRTVMDSVLAVPARMCDGLAQEDDPVRIEILLEQQLTTALRSLSEARGAVR